MTEYEAGAFFWFTFMPWILVLSKKIPLVIPTLILAPFAYWLFIQGFNEFNFLALFAIPWGWATGIELIVFDVFNISLMDMMGIKNTPGDLPSAWVSIGWLLLAGILASPAVFFLERDELNHDKKIPFQFKSTLLRSRETGVAALINVISDTTPKHVVVMEVISILSNKDTPQMHIEEARNELFDVLSSKNHPFWEAHQSWKNFNL